MTRARWLIASVAVLLAIALWWASSSRSPGAESVSEVTEHPVDEAFPEVATRAAPAKPAPAPVVARELEEFLTSDPAPSAQPYIDADGEPSRDFVRGALATAIETHLSSYKLSSDEVERITDAALRLRSAQIELRRLPQTDDAAARRSALVAEIRAADAEFADVMEMSFAEFTQQAQPGTGVDRFSADEEVGPTEYVDDFR